LPENLVHLVLKRLLSSWQILIIEFLGKFFKIVRLNWRLWLVSVAIGIIRYTLQNLWNSYSFTKFNHPLPNYNLIGDYGLCSRLNLYY
jgi:hypothetical protein